MSGPRDEPTRYDWPGGLTWIAHPDDALERSSHALVSDGEVWLVEPVEGAGIDDMVAELREVAGVVVLLDRHTRDAAAFATRYDVPVHVPSTLRDAADDLDVPVTRFSGELADTGYFELPIVTRRWWREAGLVDGPGGTVIVPEALGTNSFYRAGGERVGVHPGLRLLPPRRQLGGLAPDRLLVGHGAPVLEGAEPAISDALAGSRRRAPGAFLNALLAVLRG